MTPVFDANPQSHRRTVLVSPIAVLAIGHVVARVSRAPLGVWAWIPVMLVYWLLLALVILWSGGIARFRGWLRPSRGSPMWRGLSFLTGLLFVPVFVLNVYSLTDPWLVITWLALATIDPRIEECYWRGLLIDVAAQQWPPWLAIGYSTVCFGLSHPLLLGVSVHALAGVSAFVGTLFTGSIWAIVYWKTRSLRWPVASHAVVDLLNVSVLVFLNRAVIPGQ